MVKYAGGGAIAILGALAFFTCSPDDQTEACPTPVPNSVASAKLTEARNTARFAISYPCFVPSGQRLESTSVTGATGRQQAELVFNGPFEMTFRQSQYAPAVSADPAGASKTTISLFSNTPATLIERNDGTAKALYHLLWERNGFWYELQVFGPPQQRRAVLESARSLQ